jgi:hypothetical protein
VDVFCIERDYIFIVRAVSENMVVRALLAHVEEIPAGRHESARDEVVGVEGALSLGTR